ncbi:MAG: hypothetical protein WCI92_16145 [Bacteroidota bacterium]
MTPSELFLIYVRTLQFMKLRLRNLDETEGVYISQHEIEERFFPFPKYHRTKELQSLIDSGKLQISESISPKSGHKMFLYEVLLPGAMDIKLIKPKISGYDPDILQIIENLKYVSLSPENPEIPMYFAAFLKYRHNYMDLFFNVDDFSGRVHSPVTSLRGIIRDHLLIDGQPTIGIDVATMQPLLLGKALTQSIGPNEYSTWIDSGQDIYLIFQQKACLLTRKEAKSYFFKITFGWPNNNLANLFGNANWITWINEYKSRVEPRNTHNKGKLHNNLAWLLQSTEVAVMRKVWHSLILAGIPFLTVHDEVIVKQSDQQQALNIFSSILDNEFTYYKLNCTGPPQPTPNPQVSQSPLPAIVPPCSPAIVQSPLPPLSHQHINTLSHFQIIPPPPPPDLKHDYFGPDGLLYTHHPGLPDLC